MTKELSIDQEENRVSQRKEETQQSESRREPGAEMGKLVQAG